MVRHEATDSLENAGNRPKSAIFRILPLSIFERVNALETQIYNEYHDKLPAAFRGEGKKGAPTDFRKVAEGLRAVFFDAWGTLFIRKQLFPGARETVAGLRKAGFAIRLVTNSASLSPSEIVRSMREKGFDFAEDEIFSSGSHLRSIARDLGLREVFHLGRNESLPTVLEAGLRDVPDPELPVVAVTSVPLDSDGSIAREERAREILSRPGAIALVLNPDVSAPLVGGGRCWAAGAYGFRLARESGARVVRTGKPFPRLFEEALASVGCRPGEALMVGDTVGTDVAGGNAAGLRTLLVAQCFSPEESWRDDCEALGVWPDWTAPGIGAGFLP